MKKGQKMSFQVVYSKNNNLYIINKDTLSSQTNSKTGRETYFLLDRLKVLSLYFKV
jgi:hypothetical protein